MTNIISFPKRVNETTNVSSEYIVVGNNVISAKRSIETVSPPQNKYEYLKICKEFLDTKDYKDILCGIMDEEYYENLGEHHRRIVNYYYDLS